MLKSPSEVLQYSLSRRGAEFRLMSVWPITRGPLPNPEIQTETLPKNGPIWPILRLCLIFASCPNIRRSAQKFLARWAGLPLNDGDRFALALSQIAGKRL